ncbi:type II toxin-antitoxin system HipA family toxin [Gordonia sp. (in: high G+C Gram-positive bacteria)]|uniref:type II toxin-antitoxin system HipA family toxin n=1 Tax=Gordonia sp. (in: high G+C Gram-positive bacteria) TaxID=84139 RepID=UPI003527DB4B
MTDGTMLRVALGDTVVGHLRRRDGVSWFDFDRGYLDDPRRPVLGLSFEENVDLAVRGGARLPAWFSNLLPEGVVRTWIASDLGVASDREFDLLGRVGLDLPGAVVVTVVDADDRVLPTVFSRSVEETGSESAQLWRFSLAGVAPKFSMLGAGDKFTAPVHGEVGDWIVKLPDPVFADLPANEHAMMTLAAAAGIEVPEVRLIHRDWLDGLPEYAWRSTEDFAYAIRRFDRPSGGSRRHIEDLAQVLNRYPDDKYQGNFETVAGLLFRGYDVASLREFARRLAFFVLIGNGDAHVKNWSVIYDEPRAPRISPAYDIVATEVYRPGGRDEALGLKFNGTRRFNQIRLSDFERLERKLDAVGSGLLDVVREVVERTHAGWPEVRGNALLRREHADVITANLEVRASQLSR